MFLGLFFFPKKACDNKLDFLFGAIYFTAALLVLKLRDREGGRRGKEGEKESQQYKEFIQASVEVMHEIFYTLLFKNCHSMRSLQIHSARKLTNSH